MGEKLLVIAAFGKRVPRENPADPWIDDTAGVSVVNSRYYRRLITDGSLVVVVHSVGTTTDITADNDLGKSAKKSGGKA